MPKQEIEIAVDAGTIRHRILDAIEGFRAELKNPTINETSRKAIMPLIADGVAIASLLTVDQTIVPIPSNVMHQADVWLSHAEPLLHALQE